MSTQAQTGREMKALRDDYELTVLESQGPATNAVK